MVIMIDTYEQKRKEKGETKAKSKVKIRKG
jgi:hypothetical protein